MESSRYSKQEKQQGHDASCQPTDAPRAATMRGAMAKGQAEASMSRTANAKTPSVRTGEEDWARECLFDCYNG